jgi:uncharacterized membrane protein (DUF485 family)
MVLCKFEATVFMIFYLLAFLAMPAYAADVLGVKEGDWASYEVASAWDSTITNDTAPQYALDVNQTTWKIQVEEVISTEKIKVLVIKELENGTNRRILEGNVRNGSGNLGLWVIRKNLNVGDFLLEGEGVKVNETEPHLFAGINRLTVYAWFNEEKVGSITEYAFFWDRSTGILCGQIVSTLHIIDDEVVARTTIRLKIVNTNLWGSSVNNSWFLGLLAFIIVVVLAVIVFAWNRRKLRKRKDRKRLT